jgi:hypothetical protein
MNAGTFPLLGALDRLNDRQPTTNSSLVWLEMSDDRDERAHQAHTVGDEYGSR